MKRKCSIENERKPRLELRLMIGLGRKGWEGTVDPRKSGLVRERTGQRTVGRGPMSDAGDTAAGARSVTRHAAMKAPDKSAPQQSIPGATENLHCHFANH